MRTAVHNLRTMADDAEQSLFGGALQPLSQLHETDAADGVDDGAAPASARRQYAALLGELLVDWRSPRLTHAQRSASSSVGGARRAAPTAAARTARVCYCATLGAGRPARRTAASDGATVGATRCGGHGWLRGWRAARLTTLLSDARSAGQRSRRAATSPSRASHRRRASAAAAVDTDGAADARVCAHTVGRRRRAVHQQTKVANVQFTRRMRRRNGVGGTGRNGALQYKLDKFF